MPSGDTGTRQIQVGDDVNGYIYIGLWYWMPTKMGFHNMYSSTMLQRHVYFSVKPRSL